MALNTNLLMNIPQVRLDPAAFDSSNVLAKALQIQQAQNQNALAQYQLSSAQRGDVAAQKRLAALQEAGTDPEKISSALLAAGDIEGYTKHQQALATIGKEKAATETSRADLLNKRVDFWNNQLAGVNTPERAATWVKSAAADPAFAGLHTPESIAAELNAIPTDPKALQAWKTAHLNDATALKDSLKPYNLGPGEQRMVGKEVIAKAEAKPEIKEMSNNVDKWLVKIDPVAGTQTEIPNSRVKLSATPGEMLAHQDRVKRLEQEMATGNLTPESIEFAAQMVAQGGQNPITGMGKNAAAMRAQVINRASQIATEGGASAAEGARNVITGKQDISGQTNAIKAFNTGLEGRSVRSFNVAINHLDSLDRLATALGNGDTKAFNAVGQQFAEQTGQPAPTNFDTAKTIVGAEVAKAIAGSNMALKDREEIRDKLSRANSPAQLKGAVRELQNLMGGQLQGLEQQYTSSTGRKDFNAKLTPRAKEVFKSLSGESNAASSQSIGQRPKGVSADWTLMTDKNGARAWVSPDRTQHVEVP